jgi:Bifunctional DNA primase/polymerase, N-terminal
MSLRDMVGKAKKDAASAEQRAEEAAKDKFNAVLDEFKKSFPESLPVLVACHRASKKPVASWKGLNQDNWAEPDNLCLLARQILMGGNLAVKLGSDSNDLVAIDLDHDDHIEPFLQANPAFRNTLRTRGAKGCQFWFYATDDYPREVRKLEINGTTENAGEFRGGKCISIIWGVHENGNVYSRVNDVPPIKFAPKDVAWLTGWRVIEPKNNFKLSRNGKQNTGSPTGRRGSRRVNWDKFNEALRNGNGHAIVESLVERWFGDAVVEGGEWSCGDITGRAQNGRGSFHINPKGYCIDFDGSWSGSSVINAIVSEYRRVDFNLRGLAGHEAGIEQLPDGTTYMIERSGRWVDPFERRLVADRATH